MRIVRLCTAGAVFCIAMLAITRNADGSAHVEKVVPDGPGGEDQKVRGEMALAAHQGFLFAKTSVPGGEHGWFVVDMASKQTVVLKRMLPPDAYINTDEQQTGLPGESRLSAALGAFGVAPAILGTVHLRTLEIGGLLFHDVDALVAASLPEAGGRSTSGILGFNLLKRAEVLDVDLSISPPALRMRSSAGTVKEGYIDIPILVREEAVFLHGEINGKQVDFLLDSGAPESFVSTGAMRLAGLVAHPDSRHDVLCMNGKTVSVSSTRAGDVQLGGRNFSGMRFNIAELPVYCNFRSNETPALLGTDFLELVGRIEIDFRKNVARIPK